MSHLVHGVQKRHHLGGLIPKCTEYRERLSVSPRTGDVGK